MGIRNVIRRHRRAAFAVALVIVLGAAFGLYWFQPWKLFTRQTVDEALPAGTVAVAATPAAPETAVGSTTPAAPETAVGSTTPSVASSAPTPVPSVLVLSEGTFISQEHATSGTARILQLPDGSRIVRLENFSTSDGPDVHIWLSDRAAGLDAWRSYDDGRYLALGKLKGTDGNQNYAVPADADLSGFRSVVVWCVRFSVAFGSAPVDLARSS